MNCIKKYNFYFFTSTFIRNIIDIYSIVYLYKQNISIKNIIFIYILIYLLGIFISKYSLIIGNIIGYKYILAASSLISIYAIYIIKYTKSLYIIAIVLSLSTFTYHPIRHYYGIKLLKENKKIGNNLILIYLANIISSYIVIKNISFIYVIILSLISIIPIIFIKKEPYQKRTSIKQIPSNKILFFIFDQFRIIFILFEPLYLYLIFDNFKTVGIFNIILAISSASWLYFISRTNKITSYYKYLNFFFIIILLLKINIYNKTFLMFISLGEAIGLKTNELISTANMYYTKHLNKEYIIFCETIFCIVRLAILSLLYILNINLKLSLYLLLAGIFILSFLYKENST